MTTRDALLDELAEAEARPRPAREYVADLKAQLRSLDRPPVDGRLKRQLRVQATPPGEVG